MSFSTAIMARLGLDTSGWKKDLDRSTKDLQDSINKQAGSINGHTGVILGSQGKVKSVIKSLGADVMSGASPMQIFTDALMGLSKAFKVGFGTMVGATAIALVGKECYDAWSEAQALNKELAKLGSPIDINFSSLDALKERLAQVHDQVTRADTSINSTPGLMKTGALDMLYNTGKAMWSPIDAMRGKVQWNDTIGDLTRGRQQKREQEIALQNAIADKERAQLGYKSTGFYESGFKEQRERADAKFREALGSVQDRVGKKELTSEAGSRLIDNALAENKLEIAAIEKKEAQERNELELRKKIINAHGDELKVIQAKIDATNNDPQWQGTNEEIAKIQVQLQEQTAEKLKIEEKIAAEKEELRIREQLAGFTVTASEKALAALDAETAALQKRLKDEKDLSDLEKDRINTQIKVNNSNRPHLATQAKQERLSLNEEWIDATTGESYESKIAALREKAKQRETYQASLYGDTGADEASKAKAAKDVQAINQQIEDMERQHKDELADAVLQTRLLEAQLTGHKSIAQELAIEKNYREAINKALRDGNKELAGQLLTQQKLDIAAQGFANWKQTPEQRQQRQQQERQEQRDRERHQREKDQVQRDMESGVEVSDKGRRGDLKREIENERIAEENKRRAEAGQEPMTPKEANEFTKRQESKPWYQRDGKIRDKTEDSGFKWDEPNWKGGAWNSPKSVKERAGALGGDKPIDQKPEPLKGIAKELQQAIDAAQVLKTISNNVGVNK